MTVGNLQSSILHMYKCEIVKEERDRNLTILVNVQSIIRPVILHNQHLFTRRSPHP